MVLPSHNFSHVAYHYNYVVSSPGKNNNFKKVYIKVGFKGGGGVKIIKVCFRDIWVPHLSTCNLRKTGAK